MSLKSSEIVDVDNIGVCKIFYGIVAHEANCSA